jgi:hypothetical protein
MAEHGAHGPIGPSEEDLKQSIAAGYEKEDISIPVLLQWGFGLGVFLVATSAAAMILYIILQRPPFSPPSMNESVVRLQKQVPPPGTPIVQDNPAGDPRPDNNPQKGIDNIRQFRHDESVRMNEFATQDGNIHIPIDRAMEIGVKEFEAQKPGEPPTGVTPQPEMKLKPDTSEPTSREGVNPAEPSTREGANPAPETRPQ